MADAESPQTVPDLCAVLWGLPMQRLCCICGTSFSPGCKGVEVKDRAVEALQVG